MSPVAWRRLHTIGIYAVWSIFFLCLIDSVGRKETAHPVLGYHSFVGVLLGAMALRLVAWRQGSSPLRPRPVGASRRSSDGPRSAE